MFDSEGNLEGQYEYDAFGKLLAITDANGNEVTGSNMAAINPIRYRGYYYDKETGFYYVNSRYYDPNTGRFINPDTPEKIIEGEAAYTYCGNDPVNNVDPTGMDIVSIGDGYYVLEGWFEHKYNTLFPTGHFTIEEFWSWYGFFSSSDQLSSLFSNFGTTMVEQMAIAEYNANNIGLIRWAMTLFGKRDTAINNYLKKAKIVEKEAREQIAYIKKCQIDAIRNQFLDDNLKYAASAEEREIIRSFADKITTWVSPVDLNDYHNERPPAWFGASRSGGRKHEGIDFYPADSSRTEEGNFGYYKSMEENIKSTPRNVYAVADGKVVNFIENYYGGSNAIVVNHDGIYVLYGEIKTDLRKGHMIKQGGYIGKMMRTTEVTLMLHFEIRRLTNNNENKPVYKKYNPTVGYSLPNR